MTEQELQDTARRLDDGTEDAEDIAALGHRLVTAVCEERARADKAEADAKHWRLVAETMAGKP